MNIIKMTDLDLRNKRVLIREDFNVPLRGYTITSDARIRAALPTIQWALDQGAKIILLSHLGRPTEGKYDEIFSLTPVAIRLSELLKRPVKFEQHWLDGISFNNEDIILCENVRFNVGENANDENLARKMAALCDIFVMDAFATAHRAQASTQGIARFAPIACAGPLLVAELEALAHVLENHNRPVVAIVGGSKVSSKLSLLESLLNRVDQLIVGGGIANTFIAASGFAVGKSLYEANLIPEAKRLLELANTRGSSILIPNDVVVAKEVSAEAKALIKNITDVNEDEMILDIGPNTANYFSEILKAAATIIWNGPVGVFEIPAFEQGTKNLAHAIAASEAYSIAGGGDTLAAIEEYNVSENISYISTGGGAFLEYLEGRQLPGLAILEERAQNK